MADSREQDIIYAELVSYMKWLPSMKHVEYKMPGKAMELFHYYKCRPQLSDYTINTELPRNNKNYKIELGSAGPEEKSSSVVVVDNPKSIARMLKIYENKGGTAAILARCANQSLLADLLDTLTGPTLLVRPQYMAAVTANSFPQYVISPLMTTTGEVSVTCTSQLLLTLPTSNGERLKVAQVGVKVQFILMESHPNDKSNDEDNNKKVNQQPYTFTPLLKYKVESVLPFLNAIEGNKYDNPLHSACRFLMQMKTENERKSLSMASLSTPLLPKPNGVYSSKCDMLQKYMLKLDHAEKQTARVLGEVQTRALYFWNDYWVNMNNSSSSSNNNDDARMIRSPLYHKELTLLENVKLQDANGVAGIYSGTALKTNNSPHGYGKLVFLPQAGQVVDYWEGFFYMGQLHGRGKMRWSSGEYYEGDFVFGKREGRGELHYLTRKGYDHIIYRGEFQNNRRHGKGRMFYYNKASCNLYAYEGSFVDGKCQGKGRYIFENDNSIYEGEWKDGVFRAEKTMLRRSKKGCDEQSKKERAANN